MTVRLLVSGDLHIGRSSSRLPESTEARASAGWDRIVELAIDRRVDRVVLTGDVAESSNCFYEAIGPLERGVERLSAAGIITVAVSGNHDYDVLPRLADRLEQSGGFVLLGRGGTWERHTVDADGQPVVHLDGWSFPEAVVTDDPVANWPGVNGATAPILGLIHGDLDVPDSRYAPLSSGVMRDAAVQGWLLGHVHRPDLNDAAAPFILYTGSPQALDFGEQGVHGPWLIEIEPGGAIAPPVQIPLSTARYEWVDVDLDGVDDTAAVEQRVASALRTTEEACRAQSGSVLHGLILRLRLTGRTAMSGQLDAALAGLDDYLSADPGLEVIVDRVDRNVRPAFDLPALAGGQTPLAVTARWLLALDETPDAVEVQALLNGARQAAEMVEGQKEFRAMRMKGSSDDDAALRDIVRRQLTRLLDALHAQWETSA